MGKFYEAESSQTMALRKEKSYDKNIMNSIKFLETKYQSYKSISLNPKSKEKIKEKEKKFRTKIQSNSSIHMQKEKDDDWLSKEIIRN